MNNETDLDVYLISLINSLVIDGEVSDEYNDILENITFLLSDNSSLYFLINKSKFLSYQLILCLRDEESFSESLNFLTKNLKNLNLPEIFFTKKFIFFITDKLYEKMYQNYEVILDFIDVFICKYDFIINLMYECGFFCLLNGIIEPKTCKIYNTVFKGYIFAPNKFNIKFENNKDCFYEINRKQFDSEIIFNENNLIKYKKLSLFKQGSIIHNKIYDNLLNTSLYNLILCEFKEMGNVINYKKNNYEFLLDYRELFEMCYEGSITFLRTVRTYFANSKELEEMGFYKKISKFLEEKDFNLRFEILLILCQQDFLINFSEKKIRCIFQLLEFEIIDCIKCDENKCEGECTLLSILDFLHKIYSTSNKLYFYKISYLILLREISKKVGHLFIAEYFKDIIEFFKTDKNNISRVLFAFQTKKGVMSCDIEKAIDINEQENVKND